MQVLVLSNDLQKKELLATGLKETANIVWVAGANDFKTYKDADAIVDLLFENLPERVALLQSLLPKVIIVNSVTDTLQEIDTSFVRIAGWPTFLQGAIIESSCVKDDAKTITEDVFALFSKKMHWLHDEPGFVTPRVVSTIINEAYFALAEGVSTVEEIDTAMKLGTAYPFGPFAWSREIGLQNISNLLHKLSRQQQRYIPSELLVQETNKAI